MIRQIDTRGEFERCVRALGGVILDDTQVDKGMVADYLFPEYETVAEFKCLHKNLLADAAFGERLRGMADKWVREGKIPDSRNPRLRINLRDIPVECAQEFLSALKRPLERIVSRANRQLEGTKARFNLPRARGWLLIANDGNLVWKPDLFTHLIQRNLPPEHRTSIHAVAYFSANHPVLIPGVPTPSFFWIDGILPGREPPPEALRRKLETAWMQHHAKLMQRPVAVFPASRDPSLFEQITFADIPDSVYCFDA